jgi:iron(III) transport system permease protein
MEADRALAAPRRRWHPVRAAGVAAVALVVLAPLALILYQSFLDAPFFMPTAAFSNDAYEYVLTDSDFHSALITTVMIAVGMTVIAMPLGGILAFLVSRTDLPARRFVEPMLLVPIFLSPVVIAFGYVVAVGPVGFFSLWVKDLIGIIPWNLYSTQGLILIAGLTHVPHVYLYTSSALRSLNPEVEEAARTAGASVMRVAFTVSLPLVMPALVFSGVLVFFLGFELFGLPLVLGDPAGVLVLTTYLYKLTNLLGTPSYHLMAVVGVFIVVVTLPLVLLQRYLLRSGERYITVRGKGMAARPLSLGRYRWLALAIVLAWLFVTVVMPLSGVLLRSVVSTWGEGVRISEVLTLAHFRELIDYPNLVRGIVNTLLIASIGGFFAVVVYALIALIAHRWRGAGAMVLDYIVMMPRALPGLIAGLAFLWIFLFFKPLVPLRSTLFSLWLAYTVVWLAYGLRLISSALYQVSPDLEEAARVAGATVGRSYRDVTVPLIRFGLLGSWLLVFMIFCREYSTGVYLLGPGTEVIGSLIVSLWGTGALDLISALSVVNVVLIGAALAIALRLGVRLHA